ncbi:MAG: alpha-amylase [Bacteroidales bacterium]|nr:alpha-amylase [Bacteroidales bacterium]
MTGKLNFVFVLVLAFLFSCNTGKNKETIAKVAVETRVKHTGWSKNAVIYEVNVRQYTPEGTFNAFAAHIPRLKDLGVDILWIMPIHPVGEKNRKGTLGSYYSVRDYTAVNPEYGTIDDFKNLVSVAHNNGMYVLLDWVANHTAWDHKWMEENPDWYKKDSTGKPFAPFNWTDVVQLDYDNAGLRAEMTEALKFWVRETNIDGYRCDVAGMVPVDFWENARKELDHIKPVFMLAEDEGTPLLLENAFDMNYSWSMHHIMNHIAQGKAGLDDIKNYYAIEDSIYSKDCYRLQFITNHDENSWSGSEFERMGGAVKTFAVMSFTIPGMPLIYTGQEVGMEKRLGFFDKDEVPFLQNEYFAFYQSLIKLKKENEVFWNGASGGEMEILDAGNNAVFAFNRTNPMKDAFVILNLSAEPQVYIVPKGMAGAYTDYFSEESVVLNEGEESHLVSWAYKVFLEK